jgi:hypothetical protein
MACSPLSKTRPEMRWTTRRKRFGGAAVITEKRRLQTIMLLRAFSNGDVAAEAEAKETLKWLQENDNRCLTAAEEERWKEEER